MNKERKATKTAIIVLSSILGFVLLLHIGLLITNGVIKYKQNHPSFKVGPYNYEENIIDDYLIINSTVSYYTKNTVQSDWYPRYYESINTDNGYGIINFELGEYKKYQKALIGDTYGLNNKKQYVYLDGPNLTHLYLTNTAISHINVFDNCSKLEKIFVDSKNDLICYDNDEFYYLGKKENYKDKLYYKISLEECQGKIGEKIKTNSEEDLMLPNIIYCYVDKINKTTETIFWDDCEGKIGFVPELIHYTQKVYKLDTETVTYNLCNQEFAYSGWHLALDGDIVDLNDINFTKEIQIIEGEEYYIYNPYIFYTWYIGI